MSVIKFDRDFSTLFNWDTDENPTTEQDYQNAVKNWTETEMNIVDTLLWQPTTEYATGNIVKTPSLPSQYVLRCAEAGTSGSTEPSYSGASVGDTVTDGTVEWVIVSLATGNAADVDASNIGVNAEVDNSEAWGNAIGGGAIAEDDVRLVKGDTVYAVTSVMETNIATNTEAIEDNTEAIATNIADITQNTTDIDIAEKRISNIEKLLQGNLYDYQTDTDSKYVKTVPAGAMPYASLDSIGGKTLAWNQVLRLAAGTSTKYDITMVFEADGTATLSGTATENVDIAKVIQGYTYILGHVYWLRGCPQGSSSDTFFINTNNGRAYADGLVFTANASTTTTLHFVVYNGVNVDGVVIKVQLTDLTLMFGAGNEPTLDECKALFPASYYPYNAGTLLSAGVTEVVSNSRNYADYSDGAGVPSNTASSGSTKRIYPIGKYISGMHYANYYNAGYVTATVTNNKIEVTRTAGSDYGVGIPFDCSQGVEYTASADSTIGSGTANMSLSWYTSDGTYISGSYTTASTYTQTAPTNAVQGLLILFPSTTNVTATYTNINIMVEGAVPITYPIPAEIQALEGYGWSAGSVYNYVDFERKVFVKNVSAVDMGTLTWTLQSADYPFFYATVSDAKPTQNWTTLGLANAICPKYTTIIANDVAGTTDVDKVLAIRPATPQVRIRDSAYATASDFTTAMNGVYLYYELATPVETDISAYLTDDNLIQVESGGSLTFPNSNGDDYRIDVPSQETYMVDLQASL